MTEVYLKALASCLGGRIECNDAATLGQDAHELARIVGKTGVRQRSVAADGELTSMLAATAARRLIDAGACDAQAIDALLVCTQTPDHLIPGVSSRVHGVLGLQKACSAVDLNQGCSGFIYGLQLAAGLLHSGGATKALLVNADCYSRLIRPEDYTTRVLFGDAAAASLLSTKPGGLRLDYLRCYSDGSGYDAFVARNSALQVDAEPRGIHMDGPGILNFALSVVPEAVEHALAETGLRREDIRFFAFHQANSFVLSKLAQKLRLPAAQVPDQCAELGNTVSASIPLLLQARWPELRPGDKVLAVGFGVGLSWGAAVFEYVPAAP